MGLILVTGAAGRIGSCLLAGLPALGWRVRGFDLRAGSPTAGSPTAGSPTAGAAADGVEWVTGDVRDGAALDAAMQGTEAVVHLAGLATEAPFADLLAANIDGTYQVFEAARLAGVPRIVYASSNHAVGYTPRAPLVGTAVRPRPDTLYGLTKVFGEALGSLYADRYRMRVACLRLGAFLDRPTTVRHLATWLSPGDTVRLVHACLTAADLDYAVLYGISANTRGWWDLAPARALGYQPQDDAEKYAPSLAGQGLPEETALEQRYLGGDFIGFELGRSRA
ncbi:MAG: NAD(P)-dependent oxidoreductase [Micromonosporaceae bacterium]|nr:NAD(P)-dependent oxidoreductase [Micromonosporaceae bacterium]